MTVTYDVVDYSQMLADRRTSSYAHALAARITPGSVVLDMGTGSGIMALLACRAGAAKVYAVEPYDVIQMAREAAVANGFADRIQFVQAMTTDIDLPEKVDGIVADIRGPLPLFGTSLESMRDARDRFLKPNGWIVPARDTMWAAVVSSPELHDRIVKRWNTEYGFDFASARTRAVNQWRKKSMSAEDLLGEPQCWAVLDYQTLEHSSINGEAAWSLGRDADAHGLSVWFDSETAPGLEFSCSPAAEEHIYHQAFFPWPEATPLSAGDRIRVRFRADFLHADYVWTWDTRITEEPSGRLKAEYHQSSFLGTPLSLDRLRRRAHSFVPEPTEDLQVDRQILELMSQQVALGDIATRILASFPARFQNWNAALTRVGNLSEQYSK